jgi:hypothetical protein
VSDADTAAWQLRRLLILNDYGYTVEHHGDEGPKDLDGCPFLSDEWIERWYGKDGVYPSTWNALRRTRTRTNQRVVNASAPPAEKEPT